VLGASPTWLALPVAVLDLNSRLAEHGHDRQVKS
jgi:hypothetical protein